MNDVNTEKNLFSFFNFFMFLLPFFFFLFLFSKNFKPTNIIILKYYLWKKKSFLTANCILQRFCFLPFLFRLFFIFFSSKLYYLQKTHSTIFFFLFISVNFFFALAFWVRTYVYDFFLVCTTNKADTKIMAVKKK